MKTGSVYFYCLPVGRPDKAAFQHGPICLAEGFKELGIPFYSNVDYWQISPELGETLLKHDSAVTADDCDVVIVSQEFHARDGSLPENLFHGGRQYRTVYLDHSDGAFTSTWKPEVRQFDLVLKAHFNDRWRYPENCKNAWPFGLSNRLLRATASGLPFADRKDEILFNFRVNHFLRQTAKKEFVENFRNCLPMNDAAEAMNAAPHDSASDLAWRQSGRRHNPDYFDRLKRARACAAFCGFLTPPWPLDLHPSTSRVGVSALHRLDGILKMVGMRPTRLLQWDSWRFWESLSAGCATFHVDFEKYGVRMPVMPENWKHYVGIDLDDVQASVDRIRADPGLLERIAANGQHWVHEHYSPKPTARRFLEILASFEGD